MPSTNSTKLVSRSKREKSKGDFCKELEIASAYLELAKDVVDDIGSIPGAKDLWESITAYFSLADHITKARVDMALIVNDCGDVPFDEIKEILAQRFSELERKLDQNAIALQKVSDLASNTLLSVQKARIEMKEGFRKVLEVVKSTRVEEVVTKISNFVEYFIGEKDRIELLPKEDFIVKLEQDNFLENLKDSRTPKGDSLRTPLFEIIEQGFAIPIDGYDNIAWKALFALYYGTQNYVEVMYFLIKTHSYLSDYNYQKGDLQKYNLYFDKVRTDFQDFKHSLVGSGSSSSKSLLDKVIEVLESVKEKSFTKDKMGYLDKIEVLKDIKNKIINTKLPLILNTPVNEIKPKFTKRDISTPMGQWRDGTKVSYAIQLTSNGTFSKISDWSKPEIIRGQACPYLKLPVESERRDRIIFRKFNDEDPQLIGVIPHSQTEFRDINRDLYDTVADSNENVARRQVDILLNSGANLRETFEKGRSCMHAMASRGNSNLANGILKSHPKLDLNVKDKAGYTPLHIAAESGEADFVKLLLRKKVEINAKTNKNQLSPLHLATRNGFQKAVRSLLDSPLIDCNQKDKSGFTPMHTSISGGLEIVNTMMNHPKVDVNAKSNDGLSPLHLASMDPENKIIDTLLNNNKVNVNIADQHGKTPIHFAATLGNLNVIKSLVAHPNIDINKKTLAEEWGPLHYAVFFKKIDIALELLKQDKIDVNLSSGDGTTPLHMAIAKGLKDIVSKMLTKKGALEQKTKAGYTALHVASLRNDKDIAILLMNKGANVSAKTNDDSTPLHFAASTGQYDIANELIKRKANVNAKNKSDQRPLHIAAENGNADVVELLIENKADVKARDMNGLLFIYLAIRKGHLNLVRSLIYNRLINVNDIDERRVDDDDEDKKSIMYWSVCDAIKYGHFNITKYFINDLKKVLCDPLFRASYSGHLNIVQYLVNDKHMDIEGSGSKNMAPLIAAIFSHNLEVVKFLVQKQANVNKTYNEVPALVYAIYNDSLSIVKYLVEHGADVKYKDKEGNTILFKTLRRIEIMAYLIDDLNFDVNARNNDGETVLHRAFQYRDDRATRFLCLRGADINVKDKNNKSPSDIAKKFGTKIPRECNPLYAYVRSISYSDNKDAQFVGQEEKFRKNSKNILKQGLATSNNSHQYYAKPNPTIGSKMNDSLKSFNPTFSDNIIGTLLLLDLFFRKFKGNNHISNKASPNSKFEAQAYALKIIEKVENLLKNSDAIGKDDFDLYELHRDLSNSILSGNISKIVKALYQNLTGIPLPRWQDIEKILYDTLKETNAFSNNLLHNYSQ